MSGQMSLGVLPLSEPRFTPSIQMTQCKVNDGSWSPVQLHVNQRKGTTIDDLAPLDSASNHIVIHVDEDCGYDETEQPGSVADTEIMPTLEFWENLIDGSFLVPADEAREDPEESQILRQSSTNCLHLDDNALKVTKSTFHVEDCPVYEDLSVI
ncbi:hypothetical protein AAEP93_003109 [Penicillium crustosum]